MDTANEKVLVVGATAAQGGSVARHLVRDGRFAVRALTRARGSERALRLSAAGVEVLAGDLADPASLARALAFYYENLFTHFRPRLQDDGSHLFGFPQGDSPLAGASVEDLGGVVAAVLQQRRRFLGSTVEVVGDELQPADYARAMTEQLGRSVRYRHVPRGVFAALGFPGAQETADMFEYYRRFAPRRREAIELARDLYPGMRSFSRWLSAERERLLTALSGPEEASAAAPRASSRS